jgi:hypothetical protein
LSISILPVPERSEDSVFGVNDEVRPLHEPPLENAGLTRIIFRPSPIVIAGVAAAVTIAPNVVIVLDMDRKKPHISTYYIFLGNYRTLLSHIYIIN